VKSTRSGRRARRRTRLRGFGLFAIDSTAATNAHKFSGWIGARALAVGRYCTILIATDAAGNSSARARLAFRVIAGRPTPPDRRQRTPVLAQRSGPASRRPGPCR